MESMPEQSRGQRGAQLEKPPLESLDSGRDGAMKEKLTLVDKGDPMLEELEAAVDKMNQTAETHNISLQFRLHEESDRWMVEVWESNLEDELVQEIPPEKFLDMVASIQDMIGVMVDAHR